MKSIKQECDSCGGTGLYSGFMEGPGKAVVCLTCNGRGWYEYRFNEFIGRKKKRGIKTIKISSGREMTYEEFEKKFKS